MRTRTFVLGAAAAVLGGAVPALAQGRGAFFEVSNDLSPGQPSATVTLWVPVPDGLYAVAGVRFDASIAGEPGAAWSGPMRAAGFEAPGTSDGVVSADGRVVAGALPGQLHMPRDGVFADPSNPIAIWRATITVDDFSARELTLATDIDRAQFYTSELVFGVEDRIIADARARVVVVPAPGAWAVLAMVGGAGVLAGRRRRA